MNKGSETSNVTIRIQANRRRSLHKFFMQTPEQCDELRQWARSVAPRGSIVTVRVSA